LYQCGAEQEEKAAIIRIMNMALTMKALNVDAVIVFMVEIFLFLNMSPGGLG